MVFAAGLGTRLRPFTFEHPKALVEINGEPVLGHVIKKLIKSGVDHAIVNVHHFPDQIREYLKQNDNFGIRIDISDETDCLLDTGGAIVHAAAFIDRNEPLIIHNADILTDFNIGEMMSRHLESHADATLLVAPRRTSRYLCFDDEGRLKGWINKTTGATVPAGYSPRDNEDVMLAFGGVHIINPNTLLNEMVGFSSEPAFSIIKFYLSEIGRLDIRSYMPLTDYRWHDIGKPESLAEAREQFYAK